MKAGTKEFYEYMTAFERIIKEETYGHKIERDKSGIKGVWYKDGEVNLYFKIFLRGIAVEKCENRLSECPKCKEYLELADYWQKKQADAENKLTKFIAQEN